MTWQWRGRCYWFCTDIKPLEIEVKVVKPGQVAWRVKSAGGTFFKGKTNHPLTAMRIATHHAEEIAKNYKTPMIQAAAKEMGIEVQDIKLADVDPSDFIGFPNAPTTTNQ